MSYTGKKKWVYQDASFEDPAPSDVETGAQRLCRVCRTITISGIRGVFVHRRDHDSLIKSSERCDACYLLASSLVESPVLKWRYENRSFASNLRLQFDKIIYRDDGNDPKTLSDRVRIQDSRVRPEGGSLNDWNRHGLNQLWVTCGTLNQELRMYATSGT